MKRQILCLAAMLMMLCSCAAKEAPAAENSSSAPPSAPLSADQAQPGALRALSSGNAAGRYLVEENGDDRLLCYVDYAQAVEVPLCTSPSCAHDGENCTAWIPGSDFVFDPVCVNEETIAFIRNPLEGPPTIELADATGANRRALYTAESHCSPQTLVCADDEALYCIIYDFQEDAYGLWLYRIPLDGGAAEPVQKVPNSNPQWLGMAGNDFVLYQYDWGDTVEEAEENGGEHRVFLWNPETDEEQVLAAWHSEAGSSGRSVCWQDGRLYWNECDVPGAIYWLDAQGGTGRTDVAWPEEIASAPEAALMLEQVVNGHMLVTVWKPWGTDILKRYAVDLSGESAVPVEIPLRFVSNASEKPVQILGKTDGELFVVFEQQDALTTQVQEDGYLSRNYEITQRRGMIAWEDFLAGTPNFREITMNM